MTELEALLQPKLTQYAEARLAAEPPKYESKINIPYMGYFSEEDEPYDVLDYPEIRKRIKNNLAKAVQSRFPLESEKYVLGVDNLHFADKDFSPRDEKDALLHGKTLGTRLKGDWVLYDKASGKEIDRKQNNTFISVPYLTNRGVFIRNGNEYGLRNMFRLRPGMYTRIKGDGIIATHVNPAQGTGRQSNILLSPTTGVFTWKLGTRNYGLLPLLMAAGKTEPEIRKAWGDELFDNNYKKFKGIIEGSSKRETQEYRDLWNDKLSKYKLDPETTEMTLGRPYDTLNGDTILDTTKKILRVAQTYTDAETDNRDGLQFQNIVGAADYLPERIVRDGGGLFKKVLSRIDRDGNLSSVPSGVFQPHVDSVFQEDRHAAYIDGANPMEGIDVSTSVSRIGEGGLGSVDAASEESRGIHNSYLGFIDPIRCYAKDTELLTQTGWVKVQDVTKDTILAIPTPHYVTYAKPNSVHVYPRSEKPQIQYSDGTVEFNVTPNHRMLVKTASNGYRFVFAEDMLESDTDYMVRIYSDGVYKDHTLSRSGFKKIVYTGNVYCPSVLGGLVICRGSSNTEAFVCGNSPESQAVGLQVFLTHGVKKDSKGNLYTKLRTPDGNTSYVNMNTALKGIVATPEYFDPSGDPNEMIPAFNKGGDMDYYPRKDVNYYLADSSRLMSDNTGFIAGIGGLRSNRTMLGSKATGQAVSLPNREAPLVQRYLPGEDGEDTTTEAFMGPKLGAKFAEMNGRVLSVNDDEITYRGEDGKKHTVELYNNLPANNKGWLTNTPLVQPGDIIHKGQAIAKSNYTDDNGHAATGVNLRVAMVNGPNAGTTYDAITVSESAAKTKLASEQMYKTRVPVDNDTVYDKNRFLKAFDTSDFTKEQLDTIGEDGLVMPGTVLHKGDPMVLATSLREPGIHGVSKRGSTPIIERWEHDYPGTVIDIGSSSKNKTIYTKALTPAKVGDKMCYSEDTEILTDNGWLPIAKLTKDYKVLSVEPTKVANFLWQYPTDLIAFDYTGKMYHAFSDKLDTLVTPNHKHLVRFKHEDKWRLADSEEIFGESVDRLISSDTKHVEWVEVLDRNNVKEEWVEYTGKVYCCTVPTYHTLCVRRNGKICWSGNSTVFGNKGVIGQILPDDQMLQDANGQPFEVYQSPLGLPSRVNPMVLGSLQLGKIAKHDGKPVVWKDFTDQPMADTVLQMLQDRGLKESEDLYDPSTGKTIPDISTGYLYYLKFKHMGDSKEKARGTGLYTMEELPLKGGNESARRFGSMEIGALIGHTGAQSEILKDAKLVRGQENNEFWRAVRNGDPVPTPGIPLVHKKFFEHLRAAGVNLEDRGKNIHMFAADNKDIDKLTGNRKVSSNGTYDAKDLRPIQGGLFDPAIFGANGDQWASYDLPEPVLNPLMEKAVSSILGWKDKDLNAVLDGEMEVNGKTGPQAVKDALSNINIEKEFRAAQQALKSEKLPALKRDKLLKRYRYLGALAREHKNPSDLFLDKLPILPPKYRPVSIIGNDVGIVSDANYLYKSMIDAAQDFKEAKEALPDEMLIDARKNLHNSITALVGLTDPDDKKLQDKGIEGVLKWAFGKGSPKYSSLHRKVFGATTDTGGLAVISPDNNLGMDEVGLPENGAWAAYEPFVVRNLRQNGYPMSKAIEAVQERTPAAKQALEEELKKRPVLVNRAPTLHKYNIMALWPRITKNATISYNPLIAKGMNSDHDGDSVRNLAKIKTTQENLSRYLTNSQDGVYYSSLNQRKETAMIAKNTKIATCALSMPISDLPVVEGSEVKKSETVTEWDCQPDWYVDTVDPSTGKRVCAPIQKISKHEGLKMYDVYISCIGAYKTVVTASQDHSLITANPDTGILEQTTPKDSEGRLVPVVHGDSINDPDTCMKYLRIGILVPMSYQLGEFIGAMIGDGWVDVSNQVYIAASCDDIRKHILDMFVDTDSPLLPTPNKTLDQVLGTENSFGKQPRHKLRLGIALKCAKELKEFIGSGAENKKIPWQCLCGSKAHLLGLLSGLLSTDGSVSCGRAKGKKASIKVIHYDTTSQYLRDGIQDLCRRLGVRTSFYTYRGPHSTMDCYSISFSCEDMKKLCEENKNFKLFHGPSQEALEQIFAGLDEGAGVSSKDIVPIPKQLRGPLAYAQDPDAKNWPSIVCRLVQNGYATRANALKIAARMDTVDWQYYKDYGKKKLTAAEAKKVAEDWCSLVRRTDLKWAKVDYIKPSSCTEGWDLTVPGPYTFSLWDGTVVQDTMTFHVPVSKKAVEEAVEKMLPSKNLLSPATLKAQMLPNEEFAQGLYFATRTPKGQPIKFRTKADMLRALNNGEIKYDTPIEILEDK